MEPFVVVVTVIISCTVTALVTQSREYEKRKLLQKRFNKLVGISERAIKRRDEYKSAFNEVVDKYNELVDVANEYKRKSVQPINLFPRGCDKREVYKRLMNIYHPDKPNGCRKMSQEIQRQSKK